MKTRTKDMVISGLLCALGIIIPTFFPKIVIPPASFTLASHVPIFIAMFLSPGIAIAVALGTTLGFLLSGLPIIIVLRALTHVVFAAVGSIWYKKQNFKSIASLSVWALVCSIIHGVCEFIVVTLFYFGNNISGSYYENGFFVSVVCLVLFGTVVHSMVDFGISFVVAKALKIIPKHS